MLNDETSINDPLVVLHHLNCNLLWTKTKLENTEGSIILPIIPITRRCCSTASISHKHNLFCPHQWCFFFPFTQHSTILQHCSLYFTMIRLNYKLRGIMTFRRSRVQFPFVCFSFFVLGETLSASLASHLTWRRVLPFASFCFVPLQTKWVSIRRRGKTGLFVMSQPGTDWWNPNMAGVCSHHLICEGSNKSLLSKAGGEKK